MTSNMTVVITAHEDSNGIFHFVPPLTLTVQEGETASFQLVLFQFSFMSTLFILIPLFAERCIVNVRIVCAPAIHMADGSPCRDFIFGVHLGKSRGGGK